MRIDATVLADARVLWDYHRLDMPYERADVVLGLGSFDPAVAEHASDLFLQGGGVWLMFTGGIVNRSDLLKTPWTLPEAEVFHRIAIARGVSKDKILLERRSTNTGENLRFSREQLRRSGIACERLIIVTKPYMERRVRATAKKELGETVFAVTSCPCSFDDYCLARFDPTFIINLMVGDLQRIDLYPGLGFQEAEDVPERVRHACRRLIAAGFTQHLIEPPV